jgi:hypothetical protein
MALAVVPIMIIGSREGSFHACFPDFACACVFVRYPKYWYKKTACIKLKKYERGAFFLIKSPIYIYSKSLINF